MESEEINEKLNYFESIKDKVGGNYGFFLEGCCYSEKLIKLKSPKQVDKNNEMELIELIKPFMYCYIGSGMLTNEYDESVAVMMAKNTLNALKPYLK